MRGLSEAVHGALVRGGLLGPCDLLAVGELADPVSGDLLPGVIRSWEAAVGGAGGGQGRRARRQVEGLRAWRAGGARLTLGIPGPCHQASAGWLGRRLAWWPRGVPARRRVGLVSSRLGRAPDRRRAWFTALRAACAKMDPHGDLLLSARATTTARYVQRAAALFGIDLLRLVVPRDDAVPLGRWFDRVQARGSGRAEAAEVYVSPPLLGPSQRGDETLRGVPLQDRALVACSDCLMAFSIRREGHVHRLVEARLRDPAWPPGGVYVAIGPELVRTEMAGELMDHGAVGRVVLETGRVRGGSGRAGDRALRPAGGRPGGLDAPTPHPAAIVPLPPAANWPFLTHTTRRREGPWPDQPDSDYLDSLILDREDADHSALATLKRIVRQRRLLATAQTIRGGTPVVSFTAVPLAELDRLRVFRPHRGRWDFEPYGICVRRDWLEHLGARPVQYGDSALWEELAPDDRPFFQLRRTQSSRGRPIDWTVEDEWRVVGNVDLAPLAADAALVFVPSGAEARELAAISPWPVTVVPAH